MPDDVGFAERQDLLEALERHRGFLRQTVDGLSEEQARARTTVSKLTLGGLIKHVSLVEHGWASFIVGGPSEMGPMDADAYRRHAEGFHMSRSDTLAALLEGYSDVGRRTDALVAALPSLDATQPLPDAPWFERGVQRSARAVLVHIIAETAQHAGHADIIRESLDGTKTMG